MLLETHLQFCDGLTLNQKTKRLPQAHNSAELRDSIFTKFWLPLNFDPFLSRLSTSTCVSSKSPSVSLTLAHSSAILALTLVQ
jgi:hypothetical protein